MTRRNKILATVAVMLLFAILPMTVVPSSAFTSAPTCFYGASTSEPQIFDGLSAVIEDQTITFDITEFSDVNEDDLITEQCGRVNTSYTLYNPTEKEIDMTITLPVSGVPQDYVNNEDGIETDKYKLTVNGEVIEPTLTEGKYLDKAFGTISPDTFIPNEYTSNENFSTDMTVTKYTFMKNSAYKYRVVGIEATADEFNGSCLVFNKKAEHIDKDDGSYFLYVNVPDSDKTFDLYVFGKPLTSLPKFDMYTSPSTGVINKSDGDVKFISSETMTYAEFISRNCDFTENSRFSEQDLYNVFAKEISNVIDAGKVYSTVRAGYTYYLNYRYGASYTFNAFVYEFDIAPGERTIVSVDAPLYPSIETKYMQNTYEYEYDLYLLNDNMRKGSIDIRINTPYCVVSDGKTEYTKTDTGYSLTTYGAYMTNRINFTLCEVETPEVNKAGYLGVGIIILFFMIIYQLIQVQPYIAEFIQSAREWILGLFSF